MIAPLSQTATVAADDTPGQLLLQQLQTTTDFIDDDNNDKTHDVRRKTDVDPDDTALNWSVIAITPVDRNPNTSVADSQKPIA